MEDSHHSALVRELRQNVRQILGLDLEQPAKAIALFTAHWQTQNPTISASVESHLYYDYYGFPEEGYRITHDGKGCPEVARRVFELLQEAGFNAQLDIQRGALSIKTAENSCARSDSLIGWDHGTFVPMKLIDPPASIPSVQISVLRSQDATELLRMGKNVLRMVVG
jgi:aromatic ring-opening dioxygenase catalytic subunit (LigB family)